MSRGQGRCYRPVVRGKPTSLYWLDYSVRGERHRESSGTTVKKEALDLLRERIGGRKAGTLVGDPDAVTFTQLRELVERQYTLDGNRSLTRVQLALQHVEDFVGATVRALDLTPERLDAYAEHRLAEGAARSTVNQELAAVRRGFRLAVRKRLLATRPEIVLPKCRNVREGFFTEGDFAALLVELPDALRPVIRFARATGWRTRSEILPLTWDAVDWDDQAEEGAPVPVAGPKACIRLKAADTKGGDARVFPFAQAGEVRQLLEERWAARDGVFVFHRHGKRIASFRRAWEGACERAGLVGRLVHDLRRTAARDFRQHGVSEGEIMKLCGWKTRSMFDRYNIIDEADLGRAVERRFAPANGKQAANTEGAAAPAPSLSSSPV